MGGNPEGDAAQEPVVAHTLTAPADGGRLAAWLRGGRHLAINLQPLVGPLPTIVTAVTGPADTLASAAQGIPEGPAEAEAITVRLRRSGGAISCLADGDTAQNTRDLMERCHRRGQHAVAVLRADPDLVSELQIGSWFSAGWRLRLARRLALPRVVPVRWGPPALAADVAFWRGVRVGATRSEWRRLTRSYVVLLYHRLAGLGLPGQERWDVAPQAFRRQLRTLRLLGWRPLDAEQLRQFHVDPNATLPHRRFVVTVDDGFAEAVRELTRHGRHEPQLFVVTGAAGSTADWFGGAQLANWGELRALRRAGGAIGSHARHHIRLTDLPDRALRDELVGSLDDLRAQMPTSIPLLAYPHGAHDERVRRAAMAAGYDLAYTTQQGRNGAGTDRWCLRRVEPKIWDTTLSFMWKVVTGQSPPGRWERRLQERWHRHRPSRA